jgi:DNA-binding beta-propeller fold protein YncE
MLRQTIRLSPFGFALLAACSAAKSGEHEPIGRANLAVTNLPSSVQCMIITAAGEPTVVQAIPFGTDAGGADTSSIPLSGLPVGNVDFSGDAYNVDCAAAQGSPGTLPPDGGGFTGIAPTWIAPPVSTTLNPGEVGSVTLEFHPNGSANVGADFGGDSLKNVTTLAGLAGVAGSADGTTTSADGGAVALFKSPHAVAVDAAGNVYVADTGNHTIREITFSGGSATVTTIAGTAGVSGSTDGIGPAAQFKSPHGLVVDPTGKLLYVADFGNNTIRQIDLGTHRVSTIAGDPAPSPMNVNTESDATGVAPLTAARFNAPRGLTFGPGGNLFVVDQTGFTVRQLVITVSGTVTNVAVSTLAGKQEQAGHADDPPGSTVGGKSLFVGPTGIAFNGANLFVGDAFTIRRVTPTGVVHTFAGDAAESMGAAGAADGVGGAARIGYADQLAFDNNLSIIFADQGAATIRAMTDGAALVPWDVTTIAGSAFQHDTVDGFGADARFSYPGGVAVDPNSGTIYVADVADHTIRALK